jgi:archaellum component FlaC
VVEQRSGEREGDEGSTHSGGDGVRKGDMKKEIQALELRYEDIQEALRRKVKEGKNVFVKTKDEANKLKKWKAQHVYEVVKQGNQEVDRVSSLLRGGNE